MKSAILIGAAVLGIAGTLAACSQPSPQGPPALQPTAGNAPAPASPAAASSATPDSSGPGYTVSCKMASGPQGSWNPMVTVANTSSSPMQLPDLSVVNQPLGFDFEFFSASSAQVGTPSDGISPDQGGQINTIQPGQSEVFTFNGGGSMGLSSPPVDQSGDSVHVASCTALITGYSNAY
jgi:hypothetical protein